MRENLFSTQEAAERAGLGYWEFVNYAVGKPYHLVEGRPSFSLEEVVRREEKPEEARVERGRNGLKVIEELVGEEKGELEKRREPGREGKKREERLEKTRLEKARYLLEDKLEPYCQEYGEEKVRTITGYLVGYVGEEKARRLFQADERDQLIKLENSHLTNYLGALAVLLDSLEGRYGEKVPRNYNLLEQPERFLPLGIRQTKEELNEELEGVGKGASEEAEIKRICQETGYEEKLVKGLIGERYNVDYLDAMVRNNFNLGATNPIMGGREFPKDLWRANALRYLEGKGIANNSKLFKEHERRLKRRGLFRLKKGDKATITLSPDWHKITEGFLRDYLEVVMPKRNGGAQANGE